MKLGEALSLRALQAQQLNDLRSRISLNATGQEGTTPAEEPGALLDAYENLSKAHAELIGRITLSNATGSLNPLLQDREHMRRMRNTLESAVRASSSLTASSRYMRSELKSVSFVDVAALQEQIDKLTEAIRVLDAVIQQSNWNTDLA